eukprot:4260808-Lingulodinium_polyedra.AAC.1
MMLPGSHGGVLKCSTSMLAWYPRAFRWLYCAPGAMAGSLTGGTSWICCVLARSAVDPGAMP